MASVNKVILIGNLGADPETRYLPSGNAVTNIRTATSEKWKDKSGEQQEHTEWHRISMFGKVAEIAGEYLKKGSPVYVEGRIQTRQWEDQQGQKRTTVELVALQVTSLERRERGGARRGRLGGGDSTDRQRPLSPVAGRAAGRSRPE